MKLKSVRIPKKTREFLKKIWDKKTMEEKLRYRFNTAVFIANCEKKK